MRLSRPIVTAAAIAALVTPAVAARIVVGKPAPDFHAVTLDGHKVSLADYKGQVLIINLWATWCGPCRAELPLLNGYEMVQGKYGLAILAVMTGGSAPDSALDLDTLNDVLVPLLREAPPSETPAS